MFTVSSNQNIVFSYTDEFSAAVPAEAAQVAETPKSTKSKTPKGSKRKGKRRTQR